MTTTVVKTIGSTGDYSTLQAWEDAAPADLTAVDQVWQGQCQNQNFPVTSGTLLTIAGTTSDATRYKELTTVAGASFRDSSVQTNALRYNTANGASISGNVSYAPLVLTTENYSRISKLQFSSSSAHTISLAVDAAVGAVIDGLIVEGSCTDSYGGVLRMSCSTSGALKNTLVVQRTSGSSLIVRADSGTINFYNCDFVCPSDLTKATNGVAGSYTTWNFKNCAVFGATEPCAASANITSNITTSQCDGTKTGWTTVTYDTTTGSGFQNTVDSTRDFRLKSSSALIGAGTVDNTNLPVDIAGTTRGASNDGGCWQFVSGGGGSTYLEDSLHRPSMMALLAH
jgi:hypothetical protein